MRKYKAAWTGMAIVMTVALGLAWMACREIPNDEKVAVNISVDLQGVSEASLRNSGLKQVVMPAAEMQGDKFIAPPDEESLHLRIVLTNPKEVFYVYNYQGGGVTLLVTSGEDRVVNVEGYMVPNSTYYEMFPASHMITTNPVSERTIDLSGEPETVKVMVDYDLDTGYIYGGTVEGLNTGNTVQELPRLSEMGECPVNAYVANLADQDWGLVFPSVPVYVDYLEPSFYIDNAPVGSNIGIHLWHYSAGFYKNLSVYTGSTTTYTNSFVFQGFDPTVDLTFSPNPLEGVTAGFSEYVDIIPSGGYGTFEYGYTTENDTCEGNIYGGGGEVVPQATQAGPGPGSATYQFMVRDDCTISVIMYDCGGSTVSGSMQVDVNTYCGDTYCNGSETGDSCYEDCGECGDGVCNGPEDSETCPEDCAF
ncbi:MAG: hypothetical protein R6V10_03600 [bacterium]